MAVTIETTFWHLGPLNARYFTAGADVLAHRVEQLADNTHWLWAELARRRHPIAFWGTGASRTPLTETSTSLAQHFQFALSLPAGRSRVGYWADYQGQVEIGRRTLGSGGAYTTTTLASSATRTQQSGSLALSAGARYDVRIRLAAYDGSTPLNLFGLWLFEEDPQVADLPS